DWSSDVCSSDLIAGFFKIGVVSEFVNVDAAISQDALVSIDVADAGDGGDNSFQAFGGLRGQARHVSSLSVPNSVVAARGRNIDACYLINFYTPKDLTFQLRSP